MMKSAQSLALAESPPLGVAEISDLVQTAETHLSTLLLPENPSNNLSKDQIRQSLAASTFDGIFASLFGGVTTGVLLMNFLLELGASSVEVGLLSSIPMLLNFMQPLGAYLADRMTSRKAYIITIFSISRLLWFVLILGIGCFQFQLIQAHHLIQWTLLIIFIANILGAFGSPAWLSWMSFLVPHRLRGRYFGFRNSAASLVSLLSVPLFGVLIANWRGGTLQGYGIALAIAIIAGIISLSFQLQMTDINPQCLATPATTPTPAKLKFTQVFNGTFGKFLIYFGLWMFAVNLCAPFFNLYLINELHIKVSWVTIYNSFSTAANLLMLMVWGRLADRIGNQRILLSVGVIVAITPLLWLGVTHSSLSLWVVLPLLHLLGGGTWAAIDLCGNNIQMEIAPKGSAQYFAIAAAVGGLGGALGTTTGGFLAQYYFTGSLIGLFVLSAGLRTCALLLLLFVQEPKHQAPQTPRVLKFS